MVFARMPRHGHECGFGDNIVHTTHGTPRAVRGAHGPMHSLMEN